MLSYNENIHFEGITNPKLETLIKEGKVRKHPIEMNQTHQPVVFLLQVFPLTELELKTLFTPTQIYTIKRNLEKPPLPPKERVILFRIRRRIAQIKTQYAMLQFFSI